MRVPPVMAKSDAWSSGARCVAFWNSTSSQAKAGGVTGSRLTKTSLKPLSPPRLRARCSSASGSNRSVMSGASRVLEAHLLGFARGDDAVAQIDGQRRLLRRHLERLHVDPLAEPARQVLRQHRLDHAGGRRIVALEHQAAQSGAERRQEQALSRIGQQQLDDLAAHMLVERSRRCGAAVIADAKRKCHVATAHGPGSSATSNARVWLGWLTASVVEGVVGIGSVYW